MKLLLKTHTLKAVLAHASTEETRYYLRGIYLEQLGDSVRMTATDGRTLVCAQPQAGKAWMEPDAAFAPFILPAEIVKPIKSQFVAIEILDGVYRLASWPDDKPFDAGEKTHAAIFEHGAVQTFKPIDGTYPDYRRVIPPVKEAQTSAFNPEYLGRFAKFGDKKQPVMLTVQAHGTDPALVSGGTDDCMFFGAIMPMRRKIEGVFTIPSWFAGNTEPTDAEPDEATKTTTETEAA